MNEMTQSLCATVDRESCRDAGAVYERIWLQGRLITTTCTQHRQIAVEFAAENHWQELVREVAK